MFYTYVLKSEKDNRLYIGNTTDLKRRLYEHNIGQVTSTKSKIPLKVVYYETCLDENSAVKREQQLKTGFGRAYLNRRLGQ